MALDDIAAEIRKVLATRTFTGSLKFDCGTEGQIVLADGSAFLDDRETDCTLRLSRENLVKLLKGNLNPMLAMATGKMKLTGNPLVAMNLARLLG